MRISKVLIILLLLQGCTQSPDNRETHHDTEDEKALLALHQAYVQGWRMMDEAQVMALFEDNARIQPNALAPVEGAGKIREFWFPKDGSVTTINLFETELLGIKVMDTLATTTHRSFLDWSYTKDSLRLGMEQRGISTAVYRRQPDGSWKIWRQMWTDVYGKRKSPEP